MTTENTAIESTQKNVKELLKKRRDEAEKKHKEVEEDFVSDAFIRVSLDDPLITLPDGVLSRDDKRQIEYLHKLASSLNAAAKRQKVALDEANTLLFKKEAQIKQLTQDRQNDRRMIHTQLAGADVEKQKLLKETQSLYGEIKTLQEKLKDKDDD